MRELIDLSDKTITLDRNAFLKVKGRNKDSRVLKKVKTEDFLQVLPPITHQT